MQLRTPLGGFIDLWEVRIGDIQRLLTPADLRDALERGAIHERTPIKRPGTLTWIDASAAIAPAPPPAVVDMVVRKVPARPEGSSVRAIFLFGVCIAAAVAIFFQEARDAALPHLQPSAAPRPVVTSAPPPAPSAAAAPPPASSAVATSIPPEATSSKVASPRAPKKKMAGARSADRSPTAPR